MGSNESESFGHPLRDERCALADVINVRRAEIERCWLRALHNESSHNGHAGRADLADAIPHYLDLLAEVLRRGTSAQRDGTAAWATVAREHALTRVRRGFDISELVREFVVLRQTIFDVAARHGAVSLASSAVLSELADAAIATAVESYVSSREYAARELEAEHMAFVTHELRNPLSVARLAAEQARRACAAGESASRALDLLDRSHATLASLLESVLVTERFETGDIEVSPVETTLGEIVEQSLLAARGSAVAKGIALHVQPFDPEARLRVDRALTISAIRNLVEFAVDFSDAGEVLVCVVDAPENVELHVYDNCVGLSAEELEAIFEPFRFAAHGTKGGQAGNGLGLSIARRAIEAQGGTIHAETVKDRRPGGCHVWFVLPKNLH